LGRSIARANRVGASAQGARHDPKTPIAAARRACLAGRDDSTDRKRIGDWAEGGAHAPPVGPRRHGARLPGPDTAVAGSRGGEVDFAAASRCPLQNDADSRPVEDLPPEVLDVIAVAAEIALQQRHGRHAG
jgi:hypothetical protein